MLLHSFESSNTSDSPWSSLFSSGAAPLSAAASSAPASAATPFGNIFAGEGFADALFDLA